MMIGLRGLWTACLVALALAAAPMVRAQDAGSPEALVQKVTGEALASIKADKALQGGDTSRLFKLVDEKVLPYVDFEKTTRLAAGRYWRQATDAQRQALSREFRTTLVRTYSTAVSAVKEQTRVEQRPSRNEPGATDAVVRTRIVQPGGEPIDVDYRLEKQQGGWKIYDVNVMGVWLIENYRNQFSQQIAQSGMDGLIQSLAERNRAFASAK